MTKMEKMMAAYKNMIDAQAAYENALADLMAGDTRVWFVAKIDYVNKKCRPVKKAFRSFDSLKEIVKTDAKFSSNEEVDFIEVNNDFIKCCYYEDESNDDDFISIVTVNSSRPDVIIWSSECKEFPNSFRKLTSLLDMSKEW